MVKRFLYAEKKLKISTVLHSVIIRITIWNKYARTNYACAKNYTLKSNESIYTPLTLSFRYERIFLLISTFTYDGTRRFSVFDRETQICFHFSVATTNRNQRSNRKLKDAVRFRVHPFRLRIVSIRPIDLYFFVRGRGCKKLYFNPLTID